MSSGKSLGQGFRSLLIGSLISNTGDGIRLAALPLLATSLTSSPLLISAVTAAQFLPWITFAPVGGALVDRWQRRRTILANQAWRGLVVVLLSWLVWTSRAEIWQVCVVAFLLTLGEILVDPSTVALVPTLVDDADLDRANGRISSVEVFTNDFAGGPVGAALFSLAPWLPFLIDGSSYLASLVAFRQLPNERVLRSQSTHRGSGTIRAEAAEGFRWVRRHDVLGPLLVSQVVSYFGLATSISLLVVLVTDELQASDAVFGIVLAVGAAGAFIGTVVGAPLSARVGPRVALAGSVAVQAITLTGAATVASIPALTVLWFVNGLPAGAQRPIARSLQQRLTPNELLGRVNVTTRIFTRGVIVVGALVAGVVATKSGVRSAFVLGGFVQLVAAAMVWNSLRRLSGPTATSE